MRILLLQSLILIGIAVVGPFVVVPIFGPGFESARLLVPIFCMADLLFLFYVYLWNSLLVRSRSTISHSLFHYAPLMSLSLLALGGLVAGALGAALSLLVVNASLLLASFVLSRNLARS
jgi:O-antigen/teichoic acid export membrane protein